MRRVKVKICGITRKEDVKMVSALGADAVGFVVGVPSSPRNISLKKAKELVRYVPILVKSVLVTIPLRVHELSTIYDKVRPDIIQIHGTYPATLRGRLPNVPVIKAIAADPHNVLEAAVKAGEIFDAVLIDSFVHGQRGGTGIVHDWTLSKRIKQVIHPKPLILAGGLNPKNVAESIRIVQPYAVDVSSGVESSSGIKDSRKVSAFIESVKEVRIPHG